MIKVYLLLTLSLLLLNTHNVKAQTIRPIRSEYAQVVEVRESVQLVKRKPEKHDAAAEQPPEQYVEKTYYRTYFLTDTGEILVFPDVGVPPLALRIFEVGSCHIVRHYERDEGILSSSQIDCIIYDRP
ncbi:MAG: hypothetical protein BWY57_01111 [Betaproteobacteria bacterium ADurb.Bin341]|nr:MAG: hypothetical protein BWY57_01111 [Betaproteobacteria bacterium ADurb.Bin341]